MEVVYLKFSFSNREKKLYSLVALCCILCTSLPYFDLYASFSIVPKLLGMFERQGLLSNYTVP